MKIVWMLFVLWGLAGADGARAEEALLDPEVAFQVEANAGPAGAIDLRWKVVDGYYLYRKKLAFKLSPPLLRGGPRQPACRNNQER